MAKTRRLPTTLQLDFAQRKCERLNIPDLCEKVDFRAMIDDRAIYSENLGNLEREYPELNWTEPIMMGPRSFEAAQVQEAGDMVDDYSYGVAKKSRIKKGERAVKRVQKLKVDLKECQEAPPTEKKKKRKRKCDKTEFVEGHNVEGFYRCPSKP